MVLPQGGGQGDPIAPEEVAGHRARGPRTLLEQLSFSARESLRSTTTSTGTPCRASGAGSPMPIDSEPSPVKAITGRSGRVG